MADNKLLQQMLESLVNDDQAKAEELFHEYVVQQSREIYESMIDSEIAEEKDEDEEDEEVKEASEDEEDEDKDLDENFEDIAIEGDDEKDDMMGGDPTDDLEADLEMGDDEGEEGEKSEEELFQDLDAIVDELQAKFDELKGDEGDEMGDDEGNPFAKEDTDLETVREYVEKVATPKGGDNGVNAKSVVAGKNDMGGTTANIAKGGEEKGGDHAGLSEIKPKEDNAGNINVPGGKAGNAFSKKEPGHGAEKKGAAESADNKQSIFRGRR
jgi:hypothetical protein